MHCFFSFIDKLNPPVKSRLQMLLQPKKKKQNLLDSTINDSTVKQESWHLWQNNSKHCILHDGDDTAIGYEKFSKSTQKTSSMYIFCFTGFFCVFLFQILKEKSLCVRATQKKKNIRKLDKNWRYLKKFTYVILARDNLLVFALKI